MRDLNCYIVDDDPDAIDLIKTHIQQIPELNLLGFSTSPIDFLSKLREGLEPDLLFLDIEMPLVDGIELAQHLPAKAMIIYISGHPNYGLQAFEVNSIDYLRKPVRYSRFYTAIEKAFRLLEMQDLLNGKENLLTERNSAPYAPPKGEELISDDFFFVFSKETGLSDMRKFSEVLYIKALDTYIELFLTNDRKNIFHRTIASTEEVLPSFFIRVHRSYIINAHHIQSVSNKEIFLHSVKAGIPIGNTYRDNLNNFLEGRILGNRY